jgi:hypothetical protein
MGLSTGGGTRGEGGGGIPKGQAAAPIRALRQPLRGGPDGLC